MEEGGGGVVAVCGWEGFTTVIKQMGGDTEIHIPVDVEVGITTLFCIL